MQQKYDWDDYQFILALHRHGTLRSAASALNVNHTTVSRRLTQINRRYKGDVFERTSGGYQITPLGLKLVLAAEQLEDIVLGADRQLRAVEPDLSGEITLSIPEAIGQYLLKDELIQFCRQYPDIRLTLDSSYRFADLDRSEADVVIRGADAPPPHLVGHRLFPYYLHFYCHKEYFAQTLEKDRAWIVAPAPEFPPKWVAQSPYPDYPIAMTASDITLRHRMVCDGQGLARGACFMADQEPNLVRVGHAKPSPVAPLWVLTHPDLRDTPRIKLLMQFLVAAITAKRALIEGKLKNVTNN